MPPSEQNGIGVPRLLPQFQCLPPPASSSNAGHKSALFKPQQHSKNKRELPNSSEGAATHCLLLQPTRQPYHPSSTTAFFHSTPNISLTVQLIHPFYTSSWEQRKVSELFRVTRGYVLAATQTETEKTDEKPYPVYSSQTKDKGLMGYYKDYLYEDAITWTTDGANAGTVNYRAGKFYCTNVCGVLLSNEVKANQMIAEALNNVAKGYVSYVGNPKLMNNVMADIVIQIPTHAEEREQLSSFFANLDHLITLHQRKGKAAVSGCFLNCSSIEKVRRKAEL